MVCCSTASSHSHDTPAPSHVSHQLFNILDEPLAETATPPQEAPPSAGWDAFAAPAAASVAMPPSSTSWSAFDNGTLAVAAPRVTSHHQLPQAPQQQVPPQRQVQQQSQQQQAQLPPAPQQQQQAPADVGESWAVFGDNGGQAQQVQQQAQAQPQVMPPQQQQHAQQQQEQPRAPEPVAAQPPKPAPRQELPLVSTAWA